MRQYGGKQNLGCNLSRICATLPPRLRRQRVFSVLVLGLGLAEVALFCLGRNMSARKGLPSSTTKYGPTHLELVLTAVVVQEAIAAVVQGVETAPHLHNVKAQVRTRQQSSLRCAF